MQLPTLQQKEEVYCQQVKYGSNGSVAKTRLTRAMIAICLTAKNFKGHLIKEFLLLVEKPHGFTTICT
jgi:hypothetical protein